MAYATRHPTHPAKLILISTEAAGGTHKQRRVAMFEKLGGPEVGAMARRRFFEGHTDKVILDAWLRIAFPLYTRTPRDPNVSRRVVSNSEVLQWFTRPGGEAHTFNMLPYLSRVQCPTLVMGGEEDPMTPIECQADIASALPPHLVRFERFAGCGHAVVRMPPSALWRSSANSSLGSRRPAPASGARILHSVERAVLLRVAGALLVSHRHHVDVGIVGALRRCTRADLHDHGIATAAVDQAMTVRHACLPGRRVTGLEHGFDAILAQDDFTFEYVDQLLLMLMPVAMRGCGPWLERAAVDSTLWEAGRTT